MDIPFGELAALSAAFCWALASVWFRRAGDSTTPLRLNLLKGLIACAFLLPISMLQVASLLELDVMVWISLLISGAIGIGLGDTAYFAALNYLGERKTVLVAETGAPPIAMLLGTTLLGESLSSLAIVGIFLTLFGIAWVLSEGAGSGEPKVGSGSRLLLALAAAGCQAIGAIIARQALTTSEVGPIASSLIRMVGGLAFIAPCLLFVSPSKKSDSQPAPRKWLPIIGGTLVGTLLGIVLQQTALQFTEAAVTQTLIATSVLFVLPITWFQGQRISARAWLGASVAFSGVALLIASG